MGAGRRFNVVVLFFLKGCSVHGAASSRKHAGELENCNGLNIKHVPCAKISHDGDEQ